MIIIGLTGSIAMGKSTVADFFHQHGVPMISADQIVHDLYNGQAASLIEAAFPGTTNTNDQNHQTVDRQKLMAALTKDEAGFQKLETLIHPLVRDQEWAFLQQQKAKNTPLVLIEIPLLFETNAEDFMDAVVLVSASAEQQKKRALARPNMTPEKFNAIVNKQMPDAQKRQKADYIIDTGTTLEATENQVKTVIETLKSRGVPTAYKKWCETMG